MIKQGNPFTRFKTIWHLAQGTHRIYTKARDSTGANNKGGAGNQVRGQTGKVGIELPEMRNDKVKQEMADTDLTI